MLSIFGFLVVALVVASLLTNRLHPIVALTLIPVMGAFLAGFGFDDISLFFKSGIAKVMSTAVMFIFAIVYFGIMNRAGLFDPLINRVIKWSKGNVVSISIGTVIIGAIAHLDGSGASTFLITIPALLPVYNRLKMSPYLLVLLIGCSASIMNMVPWGGPLGRAASVINVDPSLMWQPLIPLQAVSLLILVCMAAFLGYRENQKIKNGQVCEAAGKVKVTNTQVSTVRCKKKLCLNALLTVTLIASLMIGFLPTPLMFMIAVSIALMLNFPSIKDQAEEIKHHAPNALMMSSIIIAAAVFLGVLKESGMLSSLAGSIIDIFPSVLLPYLHIIVGLFGAPFELVLNTDAFYFAMLPLVNEIVTQYGIGSESAAYALLIGNIIGTFISPFSPALWMAIGLAGIEMGKYIRYAFWWVWGLSIVLFSVAHLMNIF
ncbi:citrate transporter [Flavobacteriaceae bacterium (ex Bugula neritina AB1)]|nr:citrate transporter [Flavobacteriaceae bacterium (ex Bugula neritina AB1)]